MDFWDWGSYRFRTNLTYIYPRVNALRITNVASTSSAINTSLVVLRMLKQKIQYNKYCICNLKIQIQITLHMALLEFTNHESFFIHGIV
jgi:hypothetical protein